MSSKTSQIPKSAIIVRQNLLNKHTLGKAKTIPSSDKSCENTTTEPLPFTNTLLSTKISAQAISNLLRQDFLNSLSSDTEVDASSCAPQYQYSDTSSETSSDSFECTSSSNPPTRIPSPIGVSRAPQFQRQSKTPPTSVQELAATFHHTMPGSWQQPNQRSLGALLNRCTTSQLQDHETEATVFRAIAFRYHYLALADKLVAELKLPKAGATTALFWKRDTYDFQPEMRRVKRMYFTQLLRAACEMYIPVNAWQRPFHAPLDYLAACVAEAALTQREIERMMSRVAGAVREFRESVKGGLEISAEDVIAAAERMNEEISQKIGEAGGHDDETSESTRSSDGSDAASLAETERLPSLFLADSEDHFRAAERRSTW